MYIYIVYLKKYYKLYTLSYLFFLPLAWFLDINEVEF